MSEPKDESENLYVFRQMNVRYVRLEYNWQLSKFEADVMLHTIVKYAYLCTKGINIMGVVEGRLQGLYDLWSVIEQQTLVEVFKFELRMGVNGDPNKLLHAFAVAIQEREAQKVKDLKNLVFLCY